MLRGMILARFVVADLELGGPRRAAAGEPAREEPRGAPVGPEMMTDWRSIRDVPT